MAQQKHGQQAEGSRKHHESGNEGPSTCQKWPRTKARLLPKAATARERSLTTTTGASVRSASAQLYTYRTQPKVRASFPPAERPEVPRYSRRAAPNREPMERNRTCPSTPAPLPRGPALRCTTDRG